MIIFLVLIFFLTSSFYVVSLHESVKNTDAYIQQIYRKTQAYHIFESALPFVIETLKKDDQSIDSLKDTWAYPLTFKSEYGEITVTVFDEERFLNLNLIEDNKYKKAIERLFRILNIDSSYINNLLIWMGKKDGTLNIAFPVKRQKLDSKEELIYAGFKKEDLIGKKVGNEFFPGLFNYTTVYSKKININTASVYVLRALDERIDENLAMRIIEQRNKEPFKNINELVMIEGFNFDILYSISELIDVKSSNFHIIMEIKIGDAKASFEAIYDREKDKIIFKKFI